MDQNTREQLEFANKLIFVKRYEEADGVLRDILASSTSSDDTLIHLRRIELMSLLGRLPELSGQYLQQSQQSHDDGLSKICFVIIRMFENPDRHADHITELQAVSADFGPSALLSFALGFAGEQQGSFDRARYHYEHCLTMDPQWYPSLFGLSQIHYNMGDEAKGDQYFQQFELMAPFNVYGNFETHRRLAHEFAQMGRLDDAERAVEALVAWWMENKGFAPVEIQIYESLATAKYRLQRGDKVEAELRRDAARALSQDILNQRQVDENALYFAARVLTEHGEHEIAFQLYKRVLKVAGNNPAVVQKIGSYFLGSGDYESAQQLFESAYDQHPDNPEIRFCLLVSRLKIAAVSVEEYLIGRERIRQLADNGDRVEFLSLLNALNARFSEDWDVHFHLAELFMRMGHIKKAGQHYAKMYSLDSKGQSSRLRYANFLMNHDEPDKAMDILQSIEAPKGALSDIDAEIQWLKASYFDRKGEWSSSMDMLVPIIARDPWNINYLIHEILCLTGMRFGGNSVTAARDHWAKKLIGNEEARVNWAEYARDTEKLSNEHAYQLAYARAKLQFLYMRGSEHSLRAVVREACRFDADKGAKELLRLINTNFDHPSVYWGLGLLYKELWQLEVASMWFELTLGVANIDDRLRSLVYVDLADSYIWRNVNLPKAVEYLKLAIELFAQTGHQERRSFMVMGHALLRQGQARQAQIYLDQVKDLSGQFEVQYLMGLVQYRNGHAAKANEIWKPLLKFKTEQMRDYRIKQEILRYYFDKSPYLPRDLSKAN
ncbi:MAG: tetratricopeptide repeat protein [bacterium]